VNSIRKHILPYSENPPLPKKKKLKAALVLKTDYDGELSSDTAVSLTKMALADSSNK
jgi:hypothetical protein